MANWCIEYLNYDRLANVEVHTHLPDGRRQSEGFIRSLLPTDGTCEWRTDGP